MKPLLMVRNVEKTYGKGANKYKALDHISFEIDHGEFVGVMGSSGAGKSTSKSVADFESKAPVGSSAKISLGFEINARLAAVSCFCPPEI